MVIGVHVFKGKGLYNFWFSVHTFNGKVLCGRHGYNRFPSFFLTSKFNIGSYFLFLYKTFFVLMIYPNIHVLQYMICYLGLQEKKLMKMSENIKKERFDSLDMGERLLSVISTTI